MVSSWEALGMPRRVSNRQAQAELSAALVLRMLGEIQKGKIS